MSWRAGIICAFTLLGLISLAAACGDGGPTTEEKGQRLKIVVSLGIFADFVQGVGGDRVEVTALLPPGADPHTFEPTPRDAQRLSEADVVFINGLGLEAAVEQTIENTVRDTTRIVRFAEQSPTPPDNPHLWLDVGHATAYANVILGVLNQIDPDNPIYAANYGRYIEELTVLDEEVEGKIASIPPERRLLVTYHDSYRHLAQRYGLEVVGALATSPGQDPSPRHLAELLDAIRDRGVPAVFSEPQFRASTLERLADEAGVPVCTLYSDALDDQVRTYIDMMRFNANELARCLGDSGGY